MTKEQADSIIEQATIRGVEIEVRDDYSGRGMFGKKTYAVVGDNGDIQACIDDSEECYQIKFRVDHMGKHDVVYY